MRLVDQVDPVEGPETDDAQDGEDDKRPEERTSPPFEIFRRFARLSVSFHPSPPPAVLRPLLPFSVKETGPQEHMRVSRPAVAEGWGGLTGILGACTPGFGRPEETRSAPLFSSGDVPDLCGRSGPECCNHSKQAADQAALRGGRPDRPNRAPS